MTPGEHIAEAERLISVTPDPYEDVMRTAPPLAVYLALAHVGIAIAVELGAPHAPAAPGGEQGATQG